MYSKLIGIKVDNQSSLLDDKGKPVKIVGLTEKEKRNAIMFDEPTIIDKSLNHYLQRFKTITVNGRLVGTHKKETEKDQMAYISYLIVFYMNTYVRYKQLDALFQKIRLKFPETIDMMKTVRVEKKYFERILNLNPDYRLSSFKIPEDPSDISLAREWGNYNKRLEAVCNLLYVCRARLMYAHLALKNMKVNPENYGLDKYPLPFQPNTKVEKLKIAPEILDDLMENTDIGAPEPNNEDDSNDDPNVNEKEEEKQERKEGQPPKKRKRTEDTDSDIKSEPPVHTSQKNKDKEIAALQNKIEFNNENFEKIEKEIAIAEDNVSKLRAQIALEVNFLSKLEHDEITSTTRLTPEQQRIVGLHVTNIGDMKKHVRDALDISRVNLATQNKALEKLKQTKSTYITENASAMKELSSLVDADDMVVINTALPSVKSKGKGKGKGKEKEEAEPSDSMLVVEDDDDPFSFQSGARGTNVRRKSQRKAAASAMTKIRKALTTAERVVYNKRRKEIMKIFTEHIKVSIDPIRAYANLSDFEADVAMTDIKDPDKYLYETMRAILRNKTQPSLQSMVINMYYKVEFVYNTILEDNKETIRNIGQDYYAIADGFVNNYQNAAIFGDAGTGKTTLAFVYQKLRYGIGLDASYDGNVYNGATIGTTGYVGQSAIVAEGFMIGTIGTCRFIDEFYAVSQGTNEKFGKDFINAIMSILSENPGLCTIIIGGYMTETAKAMSENQGFGRRLPYKWDLMSPSVEELAGLFVKTFWFTHIRNLLPSVDATNFYVHMETLFLFLGGISNNPKNNTEKRTNYVKQYNYGLVDAFESVFEPNYTQLRALEPFVYGNTSIDKEIRKFPQTYINEKNAETWQTAWKEKGNVIENPQVYDPKSKPVLNGQHEIWEGSDEIKLILKKLDLIAYPLYKDKKITTDPKKMLGEATNKMETEIYNGRVYAYQQILKLFVSKISENNVRIMFEENDCVPELYKTKQRATLHIDKGAKYTENEKEFEDSSSDEEEEKKKEEKKEEDDEMEVDESKKDDKNEQEEEAVRYK